MFYDLYTELCNRVGKSPSAVASELGINKSTVSRWKTGEPSAKTIYKVAVYFKVSYSALKEGRIEPAQNDLDNLQTITLEYIRSEEEQIRRTAEFATKYAMLPESKKKIISDLIDTFLERK